MTEQPGLFWSWRPPLPTRFDNDESARATHERRRRDYHAQVASQCWAWLEGSLGKPMVLGIQGPQGSGKSTLAAAMVEAAMARGVRACAVSIDDFYLTHDEQLALATRHSGSPYLRYRGYPGTHDIGLGVRTLAELRADGPPGRVEVVAYDKSAHAGRGDRAPRERWRSVQVPLDLLILEGWMLGFAPVAPETIEPALHAPNTYLAAYAAWTHMLDALIHLDVASLDTVVAWRVDAERARRAAGESALSDEDARDYIERCLPAYRAYVPGLSAEPPTRQFIRIELGPDRLPAI